MLRAVLRQTLSQARMSSEKSSVPGGLSQASLPPFPDGRQRPLISIVDATISPSTVSISSYTKTPIMLHLTICLTNSTNPITIYIPDSFLEPMQGWCSCNYCLFDFEAGDWLPAVRMKALRCGGPFYIDPDASLQTLRPNVPWKTSVHIGGKNYPGSSDRSEDQYLCGTLLSKLKAGRRYGLAPELSYEPCWWWEPGTIEQLKWKHVSWLDWMRRRKKNFKIETLTIPHRPYFAMAVSPEIRIED